MRLSVVNLVCKIFTPMETFTVNAQKFVEFAAIALLTKLVVIIGWIHAARIAVLLDN